MSFQSHALRPTLPQAGTEIDAVQMRAQLNGLKDLIGAIQTITAAAVDETNTLPPGNPAVVDLSVTDGTLHFTFNIPQGVNGVDGVNGSNTAPMAATALLVSKAPKSSRGCVRAR